jgi:alpha-D-xyloside xylohydrolase
VGRPPGRRWRAGLTALAAVALSSAPALAQTASPSPSPAAVPATTVLQSPVLRLEVSARPYRYRLIEVRTGRVLLQHLGTSIRVGGTEPETRNLVAVERAGETGLDVRLGLGNTTRAIEVAFRLPTPEVLQVAVSYAPGHVENVTETFADQGEHYYGVWENTDGGLDTRGVRQELLGLRHVKDVNYPSARAPFYVTSRGYGIYTQSDARGRYEIAVDGRTVASFDDERLQYSVLYGPGYADVLRRFHDLSGGSALPPLWAFDPIWWRDDHHHDWEENGVKSSQALVLKDADVLAQRKIHASAIWLDRPYGTGRYGWGNMDFDETFPDPAGMIAALRERGLNLVVWIANRTANTLLDEGRRAGWVFPPDVYTDWPAVDVGRPDACAWFEKKLDAFAALGVKGYKIDRGEEAEMPDAVQNRLVTAFARLAKEGLEDRHPGDSFEFTRDVYDTGRRWTAVWNGDTDSTWGGLAASLKHALRCAAIDMPMWGSDVGGYHTGRPTKELFARWLELGAYSTLMEVKVGEGRTPWIDYDDELVEVARAQAAAHHDLVPYARSAMYEATRTAMPVMRPLVFDHPDDDTLDDRWDEYMFGPSLLVAPVLADGARSRSVYLPRGRWLDYGDRRTVREGPAAVDVPAPLGVMPLFVPEGAILPRGDILRANDTWTPSWQPRLRVEVFPRREGASRFDYFTGASVAPIETTTAGGVLTVRLGDLGVPGTVEIAAKGHGRVTSNGRPLAVGKGMSDDGRQVLAVPFRGPTRITVEGYVPVF